LRFAVELEADERDVLDCNCSICTKKGFLHLIVDDAHFTLVAGEPTVYTFGTHTAKHMFCARCGIHPFYRPRSHPDAWDVNVRCLEVPLPLARETIRRRELGTERRFDYKVRLAGPRSAAEGRRIDEIR
jgi:hypothetical protein